MAVKNLKFVDIFYAYEEKLNSRAEYYMKKYNSMPVFKAGTNSGRVTATEIGVVNRAIGFHGDVLNTAARLEGMCNQLEKKMLISESLYNEITALYGDMFKFPFKIDSQGKHQLRGKHEKVEVYSVDKKA